MIVYRSGSYVYYCATPTGVGFNPSDTQFRIMRQQNDDSGNLISVSYAYYTDPDSGMVKGGRAFQLAATDL